jgi:hypothetical protein
MPALSPFAPQVGGTVAITASTSATLTQLGAGAGTQIRVANNASVAVYIEFGASTVTASAGGSSMPILPGSSLPAQMFTVGPPGTTGSSATSGAIFVSCIASAGTTAPIFFTRGEGF